MHLTPFLEISRSKVERPIPEALVVKVADLLTM
jgi:hypothetical protein